MPRRGDPLRLRRRQLSLLGPCLLLLLLLLRLLL